MNKDDVYTLCFKFINSIFLRDGEGVRDIGVKTTFHDNESGQLPQIHPTLDFN